MKMEPIRSSETSAIKTQTPGNYPKRNILQVIFKIRSAPVAVRYKALVCSCLSDGIACLNPAEDMDVRLLFLLCVVHVTVL